ncbi:transcription termination/antitermination NusG family protein [Aeromonas media]|uniref:transcription termination/antitermination NusG family protein n=1 Tax=Aeromonas media TaxID=651 RepID=UPI003872D169
MERWYLACHKTGKHNALRVQAFLANLDIEVLIPQICMRQPRQDRPGQIRSVWEPLFPGYLFIHFDPETHHTSKVSACPGLSHLVRYGGMINPLHEAVVDEVLKLVLTVNVEAGESIKQLVRPEPHDGVTTQADKAVDGGKKWGDTFGTVLCICQGEPLLTLRNEFI